MSMVWVWILVASFFVDGFIRIMMYLSDQRALYKKLNDLWQKKSTAGLADLYSTLKKAVDINLNRFGLIGPFPIDNVDLNGKYGWVGDTVYLGLGIIKNKSFVGTDEILSSMQSYVQSTGEHFDSTVDAISDKYIVEIFLKNDLTKQFLWDDEDLYNNVDVGDEVTLTYSEIECTGVGYPKKGDKDVGKNANISA